MGCNFSTKILGPKFPFGFDLKDRNLTGFYGYAGYGYMLDPFYWGYGPFYPITDVISNYPDPPFDYESLMQKEINADNMINTIQNQLATQFMEENIKKDAMKKEEQVDGNQIESNDKKETFESENMMCGKSSVLVILATVLIIYLLLNMSQTETERKFNFF